jgi:hypothetical protein
MELPRAGDLVKLFGPIYRVPATDLFDRRALSME